MCQILKIKMKVGTEYRLHKNPTFGFRRQKASRGRGARKQVLAGFVGRGRQEYCPKISHSRIEDGASRALLEKFCDVTGFETASTSRKDSLNFLDRFVFKYIKRAPQQLRNELRNLRQIQKPL